MSKPRSAAAAVAALLVVAGCKSTALDRGEIEARQAAATEAAAGAARPIDTVTVVDPALAETERDAAVLQFTVSDAAITGPDTTRLGLIDIRMHNAGRRVNEVRLLRVPGNNTAEQVIQYVRERGRLPNDLAAAGGAGPVEPGERAEVVESILPGWYVVVSTLPGADGKPAYLHGAIKALLVTGRVHGIPQPPNRTASASVTTSDGLWRLGVTLRTSPGRTLLLEGRQRRTDLLQGENVMQVEHFGGSAGHDLVIMRAREPRTVRLYAQWLEGQRPDPPPGIIAGIPALHTRMRAWVTLKLKPGPYILFCPNYHQRTGVMGFELGELSQFVVM